jgi:methyl-accepting chemotaxis protein
MGIFGNNNDNQAEIAIAKEMAHNLNDINLEIGELVSTYQDSHDRLENVSETLGEFSERISSQLENKDLEELVEIVELVGELHTHYLQSFSAILEVSNNQMNRTNDAIEKYEALAGN